MGPDEVVLLVPRGLVVQLVCELLLMLCKLFICLIEVPREHLQHCIDVVLVCRRRLVGLLR